MLDGRGNVVQTGEDNGDVLSVSSILQSSVNDRGRFVCVESGLMARSRSTLLLALSFDAQCPLSAYESRVPDNFCSNSIAPTVALLVLYDRGRPRVADLLLPRVDKAELVTFAKWVLPELFAELGVERDGLIRHETEGAGDCDRNVFSDS